MKKKLKLIAVIFVIMALFVGIIPCKAQAPLCSITVCLKDKEGAVVNGLEISLCKIADLVDDEYRPAKGFESSGMSFYGIVQNPTPENAKEVLNYINGKKITPMKKVSDGGQCEFSDLSQGIYLVYARDNQKYRFTPYFIFLPYLLDETLYYDVSSEPKIQVNTQNSKSIYVLKKWKDNEEDKIPRPDFIKVDLKRNGKVIKTAKLSEETGWSYIFTGLPEKGNYSVVERKVKGYTPRYNGDSENGFIITNISDGASLPIAGQVWWPIGVMVIAAVAFIILGIFELKGKKNEK